MLSKIKEKWSEILRHMKEEYDISDISFNTWLKPLYIAAVESGTIYIVVPGESIGLQYIRKKYYMPLKVCIEEILGEPFEIEFFLPDQVSRIAPKPDPEQEMQKTVFEKAGLNPKYTFSSFVVGESNNLAHAAALAVAESPAEIYNPLYIYGGVGLGKTHLLQAIAHFILSRNPSMNVLYVTSETFTNEIIDAIRNNNPMSNTLFREKYRNVDVLLIDDIQFISGKETTQQEFFHTFNTLYENKKQIVISSDSSPKKIDNLQERLCSRFLWGLPVDIQSPNYETRAAILKKMQEVEKNINVPDEVLSYIANNVNSNIRELEGAWTKIIAYSKLTSSEITLPFVENVINDIIQPSEKKITPDYIIKIVAEHFNVSIADLTSKKKNQEIVYPRHLIMYLCRSLTDVALSLIGKKLGNRDHTTIIHGYDKIQREYDINEKVRTDVDILKKKIIPN